MRADSTVHVHLYHLVSTWYICFSSNEADVGLPKTEYFCEICKCSLKCNPGLGINDP
jgi:hypothetical protein